MKLDERIKMQVNIAVAQKYRSDFNLIWKKVQKGYSNDKYIISRSDETPLAVCKIYTRRDIIHPKIRLKREQEALETFARNVAPDLIKIIRPNLLVYSFIPGVDATEKKGISKEDYEQVKKNIQIIHTLGRRKKPSRYDMIFFYNELFTDYKNSKMIEEGLLNDLAEAIRNVAQLAMKKEQDITYVHGDLVPANILFQKHATYFIDWEYFRVDLPAFDYVYLDHYSKKHNLPLSITSDISEKEWEVYENLISILDEIWWKYRKTNE